MHCPAVCRRLRLVRVWRLQHGGHAAEVELDGSSLRAIAVRGGSPHCSLRLGRRVVWGLSLPYLLRRLGWYGSGAVRDLARFVHVPEMAAKCFSLICHVFARREGLAEGLM